MVREILTDKHKHDKAKSYKGTRYMYLYEDFLYKIAPTSPTQNYYYIENTIFCTKLQIIFSTNEIKSILCEICSVVWLSKFNCDHIYGQVHLRLQSN